MIHTISSENFEEALPLIKAYQAFYGVTDISDRHNRIFFSQFGINSTAGCQFMYCNENQALGFATVYISYSSTLADRVAVLNDLFVLPEQRGQGIGKQLIEHCQSYATKRDCARLQWLSSQDNKQAQALYDSLETNKSPWYFYTSKI